MSKRVWVVAAVVGVLLGAALLTMQSCTPTSKAKELNLLCWGGYEERDLIGVFERKFNVKVNAKIFNSGDTMFSLLTQSRQQYDVVVVDEEFIEKLHAANRLAKLKVSDFDFTNYFEPFKKFPLCWINGDLYAVVIRFGANGLVYNTNRLTRDEVSSYKVLWDPKVKGRVGIWGWYLPSMGVIGRSLGYASPYDITNEQFSRLSQRLIELRPQAAAIHVTPPEMMTALANEQTWVVPAGGEWVAASLRQQGKPIDWTIPEEGGLMWIETLAIVNDAPHPDVAKQYIQWMQTPEAQALLTQREASQANVPNSKAYDLLTPKQKDILKVHNEGEALALISRLSLRRLPVKQDESTWQDAWEKFKTAR